MTDEQIERAQRYRDNGMTYQAIAAALGKGYETIRCALNPEVRGRNRIRCAEYRRTHKDEQRVRWNKWRELNLEHARRAATEWRENNKELVLGYAAKWRNNNKEQIRASGAVYAKNHLAEHAARAAARRAIILGVTIGNRAEIAEIYRKAKEDKKLRCYLCGKMIKMGHRHVDHIIPLSEGGAHRPSNLAVACDSCNDSKGSKMPYEVGVLI